TARVDEHILKLAMIYSVAVEHSFEITTTGLETAIKLGEWYQQTMLTVFATVGVTPLAQCEEELVTRVKKAGGCIRRSTLQIAVKHLMDGELYNRAIRSSTRLKEAVVVQPSGQKAKFILFEK